MRNPLQLVLDFLSPAALPPASAAAPSTTSPTDVREAPTRSRQSVQHPEAALQSGGDANYFLTHPRANRETVLEGARVSYLFQRVRRRSIGFVVGPDGLEVRAPKWVTLKEVELGLQERGEWVLRKWAEIQ